MRIVGTGKTCSSVTIRVTTGARSYIFTSPGYVPIVGPKVKVEFRHLFSLQKRFSLCFSHKINANIDVFLLIDWFTVE